MSDKVIDQMDKLSVEEKNDDNNNNNEDPTTLCSEECSLYVGDLPVTATEAHLFELFSEFGGIKSIRVAKENITKKSLGYAFVNYNTPQEATAALNDQTPKVLHNCTLRVMAFQRDPAKRTTNSSGNVFIKNLDPNIDADSLSETFSTFGKVVSCKIAHDEFGQPRGFGYVLFENPQHAEGAIARMNGVLMNDRPVSVSHHVSKRERLNRLEHIKQNYTNLYVKNIAPEVGEEEFKQMFDQHGQVLSMSLPLDNELKSRGFGFVNFATHEQAVAAVEALNGLQFHDKRLYVSRAQKKYERMEEMRQQQEIQRIQRLNKFQGTNLYIKYLDASIDDKQLKEAFAKFGQITSAKIMTDDNGQSRGFGFVCYSNADEAQMAINEMHQTELHGAKIYVNLAQRKDRMNKFMSPVSPQHPSPQHMAYVKSPQQQRFGGPFLPNVYYPMHASMQGFAAAAAAAATTAPPPPPPPPQNKRGGFGAKPGPQGKFQQHHQQQNGGPQMRNNNQRPNGKHNQQAPFGSSLSAAVASASSPAAEKQVIGEALYPKVVDHASVGGDVEVASKITGMLLEQNTDALLQWFDDDSVLSKSIQQAHDAYVDYLKR